MACVEGESEKSKNTGRTRNFYLLIMLNEDSSAQILYCQQKIIIGEYHGIHYRIKYIR